ncbi:MAG: flagellar basal body-associated FliL family protein [Burkholderiales bacterium]|nr:flagellar basal body-associated FliL family protein [Burkholderiales bacterium]
MSEAVQAPAAAGGGMKKMLLLLVGALAVGGSGGGVAWWMMGRSGGAEGVEKPAPEVVPAFVPLEVFTVNLRPESGGPQNYMQVGITLKVAGEAVAEKVKAQMPEIRNRLLLMLSAKQANDLLRPEGKSKLAQELQIEVARIIDPASLKKPKAAPVNVAAASGETRPDAAEQAAEAPPEEAAEAPRPPAPMILGVLFTSFLIQ